MWHTRPASEDMTGLGARDTKPGYETGLQNRNPVCIVVVNSFTIQWKGA